MPVINRIADLGDRMTEWRRWLHRHPELEFDLPQTSAFVAERLREIGVDEIHEGIAQSGIVALIKGRAPGPVVGLRADMDALPITEETGADYASETEGKMHACGHDGHTTMLLGAAAYLAETRNFAGIVALIFQPAEEEGGGGEVMVREGVMDRFKIARVFAIHNAPGLPFGHFYTTPGPYMASVDTAWVTVRGKGGHGATPQDCIDPIVAITGMVNALQTVVARNVGAGDELVISVTQIHVGSASNIIPEEGWFCATIRAFDPAIRDLAEGRFRDIVSGLAAAHGVEIEITYERGYPPTVNDADEAEFAATVAEEIAGTGRVERRAAREMGAEDFSYMLETRPGAYLFMGTGEGHGLHHPRYDFNDEAAPMGASFLARLAERALPIG
ncbi:amidohydrolase [Thioclava sp. L04-15]|uniref:M20 aminoacylase family protein n=1 Tax=Thioclava sp. L04-15 TaxID=1915318 RepID=UPI000996BADB|nr:M20 aminoacylase family protein [Thioclava sp. L04-15]OOY28417.1 amidohydrolase [Thioclava sp. L04-15]TNE94559.1 MAG: amidohydrolase [Paracoccaceae bacterium]